jgi:hypothetical protein
MPGVTTVILVGCAARSIIESLSHAAPSKITLVGVPLGIRWAIARFAQAPGVRMTVVPIPPTIPTRWATTAGCNSVRINSLGLTNCQAHLLPVVPKDTGYFKEGVWWSINTPRWNKVAASSALIKLVMVPGPTAYQALVTFIIVAFSVK